MANKIDYYEDFLRAAEAREKLARERNARKILYVFAVLFAYALGAFLLFSRYTGFSLFNDNQQIQNALVLENRLNKLEEKLEALISQQNSNISFQYLNGRVSELEVKNSHLYQTILKDADTAITPKLLNEEQKNLTEKFEDLKERFESLWNILTGIIVTIFLAILSYLGKLFFATIFPKLKE